MFPGFIDKKKKKKDMQSTILETVMHSTKSPVTWGRCVGITVEILSDICLKSGRWMENEKSNLT